MRFMGGAMDPQGETRKPLKPGLAELVEAVSFFRFYDGERKEPAFDKLRQAGFWR
jgi:hypothetical protein